MTRVIIDDQSLYDIADSIRGKLGVETLYLPSEMSDAIDSIPTGYSLTSEDEGKVVVEDGGSYVLQSQTSQTITSNGTYDTTTVNELIANIEGGEGGSKNIRIGTTAPSSGTGVNGDIYVQYEEDQLIGNYGGCSIDSIEQYGDGILITATRNTTDSYGGIVVYLPVNQVSITVTGESGFIQTGTADKGSKMPSIVRSGTGRGAYYNGNNTYTKSGEQGFFAYQETPQGSSMTFAFVPVSGTIDVDDYGDKITDVYLKVNGSWVPIEGQDIDDVNTGTLLMRKSVDANGTYDPTDDNVDGYSLVTVNVPQSGGGGAAWVSVDAFANPVTFSNTNGVTIESQSRSGNSVTLNLKEVSSGYEGFNIPINGLTVGDTYKIEFTYQLTSGAYFSGGQYQIGFIITPTMQTSYSQNYWGNNVTPRDMDEHTFSKVFDADATTMYFSMALSGLSDSVDNYVTLSNVSVKHLSDEGGGSQPPTPTVKGFEVYRADGAGSSQTQHGINDNNYLVMYFDDNMSQSYTLNGESKQFTVIANGAQQTLATTVEVENPQPEATYQNAAITGFSLAGSTVTESHNDAGSYVSVVGGWVSYESGGTIYEHAASGTTNEIVMNSAHDTLLLFVGACGSLSNLDTIAVNGTTYTITNIGNHYGKIGMYGAIVIENNTSTTVTVTLPASCYSYVSVIGID